jgi:2-polyprenyl-6-methoxyphenol hydroxylase-like FAD-dependent oxidoreductase
MVTRNYDIITVGGGLASATVAKAMAEQGAQVLVVERETDFKDRVRGEALAPWGVAEARALGLYDLLVDACGHALRFWTQYRHAMPISQRDIVTTTPHQAPWLTFYHPAMQELVLSAAAHAGAEVWRGARVHHVQPGAPPTAHIEHAGRVQTLQARCVVAGDGRHSLVRHWAGFAVHHDPPLVVIAGVLLDGCSVTPETAHLARNVDIGSACFLFPQRHNRVRAYVAYQQEAYARFHGAADLPAVVAACVQGGLPAAVFTDAKAIGPLTTFDAADTWVPHPYHAGVALLGDAAAATDPTRGQGLALALRDARLLRDQLCAHDDWEAAGHAYAEAHDHAYQVIHTVIQWFTALYMERGPEAEARRVRALPLQAQDRSRVPDVFHSGPEVRLDESRRKRFFGEA